MKARKESQPDVGRLISEITAGTRIVSVSGLTSVSAKAYVLSKVQAATGKHLAIVASTNEDAETWSCDLQFWNDDSGASVLMLPSFDSDVYSGVSPHAETQEQRALTLWQLTQRKPAFVVLSARSLVTRTVASKEMSGFGAVIRRDEDFAPNALVERLVAAGYVREEPINNIGQFSIRGGIVDVWSPDADNPVRIEFFDDTVDSIREFYPDTQLSIGQLPEAGFAPMREFKVTPQDMRDWAFFAADRFPDERFARNLKDRTDFAGEGETFSGWEFLIALTKPPAGTVFDYLDDCVFVIDEPQLIEQTLSTFYENTAKHFRQTVEADDIALDPAELFLEAAQLFKKLEPAKRIELRTLGKTAAETDEEFAVGGGSESASSTKTGQSPLFLFPTAEKSKDFEILSRSTRKFHGDLRSFAEDLRAMPLPPLLAMETLGLAERA